MKEKYLNKNMVSIIMPNYNCAPYIERAIESVILQTYNNWELLIVDDASSDNSVDVICKYQQKNKKIKLFVHESKKNAAIARNTALKNAKGKYIAFLDSDDYWDKYKLEKQVKYMEDNDIKFCCHAYRNVNVYGTTLSNDIKPPLKINYDDCLRLSNPIGNLTVMYDREKLGIIYSPNIKRRNDYAMWLQILKNTDYCFGMNDMLAYHRIGVANSISKNKLALIFYHWILYRKIEKINLFKCLYLMFCWIYFKGIKKLLSNEQA